jgi:hypothetical protein
LADTDRNLKKGAVILVNTGKTVVGLELTACGCTEFPGGVWRQKRITVSKKLPTWAHRTGLSSG